TRLQSRRAITAAGGQTRAVQLPAQFRRLHKNTVSHTPRIWLDQPLAVGARLKLPADKAHHVNTVLRLRAGNPLLLFNGDGNEYAATITDAKRNAVEINIEAAASPQRESPLHITLAQGIARGDRMDFAVAKAVELG